MSVFGTVKNGQIVLHDGVTLPEGTLVEVLPEAEWEESETSLHVESETPLEYPHPLAPYDREKEIALLRERLADGTTP